MVSIDIPLLFLVEMIPLSIFGGGCLLATTERGYQILLKKMVPILLLVNILLIYLIFDSINELKNSEIAFATLRFSISTVLIITFNFISIWKIIRR